MLIKTTFLCVVIFASIGIFSKKRMNIDYMIRQQNCQKLATQTRKLKLSYEKNNSYICERSSEYFKCAKFDESFNQLTEMSKYKIQHEDQYSLHLIAHKSREEIMMNLKNKTASTSQIRVRLPKLGSEKQNEGLEAIVCKAELIYKEQASKQFPELLAGN